MTKRRTDDTTINTNTSEINAEEIQTSSVSPPIAPETPGDHIAAEPPPNVSAFLGDPTFSDDKDADQFRQMEEQLQQAYPLKGPYARCLIRDAADAQMDVLHCKARVRDFATTGRLKAIIQCVIEVGGSSGISKEELDLKAMEFARRFLTDAAWRAERQKDGGGDYAEGEIVAKVMALYGKYQQQNERMLRSAQARRNSAFKQLERLLKDARRTGR